MSDLRWTREAPKEEPMDPVTYAWRELARDPLYGLLGSLVRERGDNHKPGEEKRDAT